MTKKELKEIIDRIDPKGNIFIDIHVIQSFPAHCMNRDDTGSPKTMIFGGVVRNRVSSQCWMYAIREAFRKYYAKEECGIRTRDYPEEIAKEVLKIDPGIPEDTALEAVKKVLIIGKALPDPDRKDNKKSSKSASKKNEETAESSETAASANGDNTDTDQENEKNAADKEAKKTIFFISRKQIEAVAKIAVEYIKDNKVSPDGKAETPKVTANRYKPLVEKALTENPCVDMVLCGRMAAGNKDLDYEAAREIADAFTTHEAIEEYDYFTCVDDLNKNGAAHLDIQSFTSGTLYRYINLNINEVLEMLSDEETVKGATILTKTFIESLPEGKIKAKAHDCLPSLVYVTIRDDHPNNLCNAFEKAVKAERGEGYISNSKAALKNYAIELDESYGDPVMAWTVMDDWGDKAKKVSVKELQTDLEEVLKAYIENRRK